LSKLVIYLTIFALSGIRIKTDQPRRATLLSLCYLKAEPEKSRNLSNKTA